MCLQSEAASLGARLLCAREVRTATARTRSSGMSLNVRFFRHGGICRPMNRFFNCLGRSTAPRPGSAQTVVKDAPEVLRPTHRRDEYRPVIPQRVARQQSPPPLHRQAHPKPVPGSGTMNFQRTVNSVLTVCLSPGDNPSTSYWISIPPLCENALTCVTVTVAGPTQAAALPPAVSESSN